MLLADRTRDYSAGALGVSDYEARFRKLEKQAAKDVRGAAIDRFADVRYAGQSYELTIPWGADFHKAHQRVYGYSDAKRATQIVTLRVRATVRVERPELRGAEKRAKFGEKRRVWIDGRWREVGPSRRGPALIVDYGSTTLVPAGWSIKEDGAGSLILRRDASSATKRRTRSPSG
jgi:N-methylhydantoinase A